MHSWHAKSPCCRAKIHHFGSRRHQCSYCKRTWRIRNKRRGRKPRRAYPQSLKAVFLEIGPFHRRFDDRTFHAVSGVGISGQITFGLLGISVQITVGCAPRACTPDRIKVIVCSLTRFQPPCNPSIAARIKTFWPGFTTAQQSSISLIATAASAGSKR